MTVRWSREPDRSCRQLFEPLRPRFQRTVLSNVVANEDLAVVINAARRLTSGSSACFAAMVAARASGSSASADEAAEHARDGSPRRPSA